MRESYFTVRKKQGFIGCLAHYEVVEKIRRGDMTIKSIENEEEKRQVATILIQCLIRMLLAKSRVAKLRSPKSAGFRTCVLPSSMHNNAIDYKKVYALLVDKDFAIDSSVVMGFLAMSCVKNFEDIEFLDEAQVVQLVELYKPGVPRRKLAKLLKR